MSETTEMLKLIGKNLKAIREKLGYSQDNLAAVLGLSRSNIANYESGKRSIPIVHIPKIAAFFGIKANELLEKDETKIELNYAFAFKANDLTVKDIICISEFKEIVSNYLELEKKC
jgi:transcriptional regulator with XRE-family HTH domain